MTVCDITKLDSFSRSIEQLRQVAVVVCGCDLLLLLTKPLQTIYAYIFIELGTSHIPVTVSERLEMEDLCSGIFVSN